MNSWVPLLFTWNYLSIANWLCAVCSAAQSCSTLCDPMDCNQPGSSVHGILQARILEWVAMPFSRDPPGDLSNPGIKPRSPTLQAGSVLTELSGKPNNTGVGILQYKIKSFVLFLKSPFSFHPASWNVDGLTADHDGGHERGRNKIKRAYSSYLPTSVLLTSGVSHSWKNLILIGINHTSQW